MEGLVFWDRKGTRGHFVLVTNEDEVHLDLSFNIRKRTGVDRYLDEIASRREIFRYLCVTFTILQICNLTKT